MIHSAMTSISILGCTLVKTDGSTTYPPYFSEMPGFGSNTQGEYESGYWSTALSHLDKFLRDSFFDCYSESEV